LFCRSSKAFAFCGSAWAAPPRIIALELQKAALCAAFGFGLGRYVCE
jgi:hypothetical protein